MFYNDQNLPMNTWPPTVQNRPDRRLKIIWCLIVAIIFLTLSVAALIIVFAVEHSWFSDSFTPNSTNHYGLWRLCFFSNQTCDSWFSTNGSYSLYIEQRLSQARVGINAWQALEIVFLFLITSTLIIAFISCICYLLKKSIHYYLAILAVFCAWPAASVGIAGLFVFGFSVYNVSTEPRSLDWCFYVNLVAVILAVIGALLLTIYDILLKKPDKNDRDGNINEAFVDINNYPGILNPSTYVVVRQNNKKKRMKTYDHPQVLHPHQYFPTRTANNNNNSNSDYITNPNHQMLTPYTSVTNNQYRNPPIQQQQQQTSNPYRNPDLLTSPSMTSIPPQQRYPQPPVSSYPYQSSHWHQPRTNPMNYTSESVNDYIQRGIYRPTRLNPPERTIQQREEPRVLHFYTGFDHFSTIDPSDVFAIRQHPKLPGSGSPVRYTGNPSYY